MIDLGGKDLVLWAKKRVDRKPLFKSPRQIPLCSWLTTRLVRKIVENRVNEIRAITGIAKANRMAWPTVLCKAFAVEHVLLEVVQHLVRRLGIDEHRFR